MEPQIRTNPPHRSIGLLVLVLLALLGMACGPIETTTGTESPPTTGPSPTVAPTPVPGGEPEDSTTSTTGQQVLDPAVDQALGSYGPWQAREIPPFADGRSLDEDKFDAADRIAVTCKPALEPRTFRPGVFDQFATFPFSGDVLPGLLVDGNRIEDGDLNVLPLDRDPIPLLVDLASEAPTVTVDEPNPSSLRQAVAQLMRDADARITDLSVVPANIRFVQQEVHSYEEAVLSMGVSLRYDSPDLRAKFESAFEQQKGTEKHSVMVRLLQPMFTISADRSGIRSPGDYVDPATTMSEIQQLEGQGRLGQGAPPVLIDAVTYGRVVYMTVTSTEVTSSDQLTAAVSASWGNVSGTGDLSKAHKDVLEQSEIRVEAYGGDDDLALTALRNGTIQGFMQQVNTSTAAPLSMVLRTLDGAKLSIEDAATITDIGCDRVKKADTYKLVIDITDDVWADLTINRKKIATFKSSHSSYDITKHLRAGSNNTVELYYRPSWCVGGSMTTSFLVNGQAAKEWRIRGHAGEWACAETGTWHIDTRDSSVSLASGPPALRETK